MPLNLEQMSDAELDALMQQQKPQKKPLEQMDDTELDALMQGAPQKEKIKVKNEMHPDINLSTRLLVKNLGKDVESQIATIQKNHPNLEVKLHRGGIIAKRPEETTWKKLDPQGLISPAEFLKDVGDVAYDVGSGIAEGAAVVGGALGGTLVAPGPGTIAGGMAAGAGAGALTEAAKIKLGRALGMPQEVEARDVLVSGGLGALSAPLFGVGKIAAPAARGAISKGLQKITEKGILPMAAAPIGKGLSKAYNTATRKVGTKIAEMFSGIKKENYQRFFAKPQVMDNIALEGQGAVAEGEIKKLYAANKEAQQKIADEMNTYMRESGDLIDIAPLKEKISKEVDRLKIKSVAQGLDSIEADRLVSLQDLYSNAFQRSMSAVEAGIDSTGNRIEKEVMRKVDLPDFVDANQAFNIKENFQAASNYFKAPAAAGKPKPASHKSLQSFSEGLVGGINEAMDETFEKAPLLREKWKETIENDKFIEKQFTNPGTSPKFQDEHVFDDKGLKTLEKLKHSKTGKKGEKNVITDRVEELETKFKDTEFAPNLVETSKDLQAFKDLYEPTLMPRQFGAGRILSGGTVGTALGFIAGQSLGEGSDFGWGAGRLGAAAGGSLGIALTSPTAMKFLLKQGLRAEQAAKEMTSKYGKNLGLQYAPTPYGRQILGQTAWNTMQTPTKEQ